MNILDNIKSKFRFKSLYDMQRVLSNEDKCIKFLEMVIWEGVPVSPFDKTSKVYVCSNGMYRCKNTGKYFTIKTGTIFENTKLSLMQWFMAIYLVTSHKKGIASTQLAKDINVTQKTAWVLLHKIRMILACENDNELSGEIECDETFIGGKNSNRHLDKKVKNSQGRSFKDKTPVQGILQRNGKLNAYVVPNTQSSSLLPNIRRCVAPDSIIYSDEWWGYRNLDEFFREHHFVDHKRKQYADGNITTNRMEGAWRIFKTAIVVTHHNCVRKRHLQKYVNEFVFRYNTRSMEEFDRFVHAILNSTLRITKNEVLYGY